MNHFSFEISLLAMIPGLFLCGYVFYKDKVEKEPISLLALLFGIGAVAYVPACFLQEWVVDIIDRLFAGGMQFSTEGVLTYASVGTQWLHNILCAVIGYALIQICLKWAGLFFCTHKNKNFNYLFDGVVYSVFLALGFAVAEFIHFALRNDVELLLPKLLTSVPCHLFVGILMGYYYTMWRMRFLANGIENKLLADGLVKEDKIRSSAGWLLGSFAVPVLVNGLYALTASLKDHILVTVFYGVVFVLYGLSFAAINSLASREMASKRYLCRVIAKGHPELTQEQIETAVSPCVDMEGEDSK